MFVTNLKIAFRNLWRNKAYSFINISGLAIGMACAILLLLWVNHEMSYNTFFDDAEQIYQVNNWQVHNNRKNPLPNLAEPLIRTIKEHYPQIEYASQFNAWGENMLVDYRGQSQYINIQNAAPDFFRIFSFPFISGNRNTCLNGANALVVTEKIAKKIFGNENPIGKTVTINKKEVFTVTAVVKDLPSNTTISFGALIPMTFHYKRFPNGVGKWNSHSYFGYAKIKKGTNIDTLNHRLENVYKKYADSKSKTTVFLSPILKRHLYYIDGSPTGIKQVKLYLSLAILILIIACFNFMNLSTARAAKRAKEIGLKKAIGATYPQMIKQFMGESLLITVISANFGLLLVQLFLPFFNDIMHRNLTLNYASFEFWLILLGVIVGTGIIAGAYPAFYLSSFNPIAVLKGKFTKGKGGRRLRTFLVVLQFTLASALLTYTLGIVLQTHYLATMDIGLDLKDVIRLNVNPDLQKNYKNIKAELSKNSHIEAISQGNNFPFSVYSNGWGMQWEGKDPDYNPLITYPTVDGDYAKVFRLKMLEGRFYNSDNPLADSTALVINEKFAKIINPKQSVINELLSGKRIIGVVKNYHITPVTEQLQPVCFLQGGWINYIFIRYNKGNRKEAISTVKKIAEKYAPGYPVIYGFLQDDYNKLFDSSKARVKTLLAASILAIIVSCLGLFGLASFSAEERTKEIGVRKVLGATMPQLIGIFIRDFSRWIIIASIIACPITYFALNNWLQNYPLHIEFPYWLFVVVFVLLLIIAFITIAYQSWKLATKNPIESLIDE